jgi:hypothetical protein
MSAEKASKTSRNPTTSRIMAKKQFANSHFATQGSQNSGRVSQPKFDQFWKKNSDLGNLSTLKKSKFLRNQVMKQWQIHTLTSNHESGMTSSSKFMQDLQLLSSKKTG